jgi:hypothetical protein
MRALIVAAIGVSICAAGCVGQQRFRFVPARTACFPETASAPPVAAPADQRPSLDCRQSQYSLGFIEFDAQGKVFDPNQEAAVLKLLDREKAQTPGGKIIMVVYVHGWKNDAAEAEPGGKPKDVERFQSALSELGYRAARAAQAANTKAVPIVGVYMAWRGKTLMGPSWFTFVSLWGRRNTANRIGNGADLAPTLNRIIEKTNGANGSSRVLMIGHSFGARVLEHAIETQKVKLYDTVPDSGLVNPRVDLVLYVNSANDSRLSMGRLQDLRAHPFQLRHPDFNPAECAAPPGALSPDDKQSRAARCRDYPLLVTITSKGDLATKYLLPIANTLNGDSNSAPAPPLPTKDEFADPLPAAGRYKKVAAGHFPFLQSHVTREVACPAISPSAVQAQREKAFHPVCALDDTDCRFVFRTLGEQPTCFQVDARPDVDGKPPFNRTPFWIMSVEPTVIADHGDIWNLSFVEMLGQLMAPRGFFEAGAGRVQLRANAGR